MFTSASDSAPPHFGPAEWDGFPKLWERNSSYLKTISKMTESNNSISVAVNGVGSTNVTTNAELQPRLCRLGDLLEEWQTEALAAHEARVNDTPRGPLSRFEILDRELGGCFLPGLHFVHGQPGTGKTALGLQLAANCGTPALFLSCEMAPIELLRRHTARATSTYLGKFKSGELSPALSLSLVQRAIATAPQLAILDSTCAPARPEFLRDCIRIARGASPHIFVVIDSLQSWVEGVVPQASEYEALGEGIARLRQLSHELKAPFFLMCERNRESMKNGGLSAGAGTRKIEYSAETVMDLSVDEGARVDVQGEKAVRLCLTKNRHGAVGKVVSLSFNGGFQRFKAE
jgi:replicative DNA helicase